MLGLLAALPGYAASMAPGLQQITGVDAVSLRSIAGWLRQSGRDGFVGADVADVMGIPRQVTEDVLEARQRGFRNEDVLRIAQISTDDKRDFLLFMVQRPDDQVYFYFSTVREGLKKAFVSIPSRNLVMPLDRLEAEARFRQEVRYWGERMESP
ncbi:MAG TPA: hypothetical protein VFA36_04260 [Burkholderiales bacterium]|nr:hypothetical protein [Burkholderiales bacterium]